MILSDYIIKTILKMKGYFLIAFFILQVSISAKEPFKIEYLYIDSNTGQSSGGHTAIKVGNLVYHFQHYPDKIFRIVREKWSEFRFIYNVIDNRTIRSNQIEVSQETYNLIRDNLNKTYLIQNKHLTNYSNFFNDRILIEAFQEKDHRIRLRGAGYFSEFKKQSSDLNFISNLIEKKYGSQFITKKIKFVKNNIRNIKIFIHPLKNEIASPKKNEYPFSEETFSEVFINNSHLLEAFLAIDERRELKPQSFFYADDLKLTDKDIEKMNLYSKNLENQIVELVNFDRKGSGYSLLVALARYLVIKKSIQENRLYFLDCFDSRHSLISRKAIRASLEIHPLQKETFSYYKVLKEKIFVKEEFDEFDYSMLEDSANRHNEMIKGVVGFEPIRTTYEKLLPYKEKEIQIFSPTIYSDEEVSEFHKIAKFKEEEYLKKIQQIYNYDLFLRNCVTEIFDTLNSYFIHGEKESKFRLGGYIQGKDTLVFVPFISSFKVSKTYKIHKLEDLFSYRRLKVKQMKETENSIKVFFRESNIFTSSFYKRNPEDSFFIFFTDEEILPRPIFGVVNFFAGIAETLYGVVLLPFDRGETFVKGIKGMFFSVPEIFFINIRKGTFTYIDKSDLPEDFLKEND
ncbi:MAG: hypothetical protein L6Q54_10160 [Leptospiraceae bacterium]|nr:hypothetical protein [Leptospiraceae bacterium]MCK6381591.1 hypothetical protein [Leptospiraceae bacterium]NUM40633.1 hypothetical protein [Leptospiraceae bacterium]